MTSRRLVDVREYLTADGENPYREWLDTLDVRAQESWKAYQEEKRRGKTK